MSRRRILGGYGYAGDVLARESQSSSLDRPDPGAPPRVVGLVAVLCRQNSCLLTYARDGEPRLANAAEGTCAWSEMSEDGLELGGPFGGEVEGRKGKKSSAAGRG